MLDIITLTNMQRLNKEYNDIVKNPPNGISAGPKDKNMFEWDATLVGPGGTPYEGGVFYLNIIFPSNYPYLPPKVIFKTPIFHCNVNSRGEICLDILKSTWSPALKIDLVLLSISALLAAPNPNDPFVPEIAHLLNSNKQEHDNRARAHTLKYASGNN